MSYYSFKRRNYGLLSIIFGCLFLVVGVITFFLFDPICFEVLKRIMTLKENCFERRTYEKFPFPLTLKVYIFDVLNKDEVQAGGKPILKEIGPFAFDEYHWKTNITDDDDLDTMEYDVWNKYVFRANLSDGLTGDEVITTLHPVLVGIGMTTHLEFREFMHVAVAAINELFENPSDVFWTGKAMDLLFNGIEINCNTSEPLTKLACNQIRKRNIPSFQSIGNKRLKFSVFGAKNVSNQGRWKIYRGVENLYNAGKVVEINGKSELDIWNGNPCNQIAGTDGILFSPLIDVQKPLPIYPGPLCTTLYLNYKRKASYRGMELHVFTHEFVDFRENNLTCYCRQLPGRPNECPIKGTMDLLPCFKAPITLSHPHFINADPSLLANIIGLSPDEKKHEMFFGLEVIAGIAMTPTARLQLNFELEPIKEVAVMSKLPKMLFPFLWLEVTADIPDKFANILKYMLVLGKKLNSFGKWLTMTCFLFGTIGCFTLFILQRFTNVGIFETEETLKKSPIAFLNVEPIEDTYELTPIRGIVGKKD